MFGNIVVGLKPGMQNDALLDLARQVTSPESKIHLVTLVTAGTQEDPADQLKSAEREIQSYVESLKDTGAEVTHEVGVIAAAAAVELLQIAATREADLIVAGLAKRSRVGKALIGSDAQRLLLGAECPVLAARLPS